MLSLGEKFVEQLEGKIDVSIANGIEHPPGGFCLPPPHELADGIGVTEALEEGIVNKVYEADTPEAFVRQVVDYGHRFCTPHGAPLAVGRIKRAVQSGLDGSLELGLALERELQSQLFVSNDAKEGFAAFTEKRKPAFRGR